MKFLNFILLLVLLSMYSCGKGERTGKFNFNDDWRFMIEDDSAIKDKDFFQFDYDDSVWEYISLPHSANIEPFIVNEQWQGVCWYRKS